MCVWERERERERVTELEHHDFEGCEALGWKCILLGPLAFRLSDPDWNHILGPPGSPACWLNLWILGLVSLHNCTSQFLTTNLFPYSETAICQTGEAASIPGSGRSPGEGNGNPLQWVPGKSHGHRSLVGYSPRGSKDLYTTEWLSNNSIYNTYEIKNQIKMGRTIILIP